MRWKFWSFVVLLGCCSAAFASARLQPERRGVSLIVVPTQGTAADLRARIQSGTSFETLAAAHSTDPTAARAGYMGMTEEANLRQDFRDALKGLKPGDVSPVTQIGNEFLLLKWTTENEDRWRLQCDDALGVLQQGRYPEAASLFLEAVLQAENFGADDVRLAESLNGLALVYRYQQNYMEAELRARRALAILERAAGASHGAVLPSLVNLANISRAIGRNAEAEQLYSRILSVRWGTPEATAVNATDVLEKLADVLTLASSRDRGLEKAIENYRRAVSESKLNKDLFIGMRESLLDVSLLSEAESLMQHAVSLHPDSPKLRHQLAEVYVKQGRYEKAIEALREAARPNSRLDPAAERSQRSLFYATIAQMNFFLVRFDDAFAALTTALELNPNSASSRLLLGALYLRRNKLAEAAVEYGRVVSANPLVADAYDGLAQVNLALGRYADAVRSADKALEIEPGLQSSRYAKAMALIRDGRDREGQATRAEYQQREMERKTAEARSMEIVEIDITSSALLDRERPQEAMEVLREGIRSHPLIAVLHRKLGLLQSRLGLHREAAETLEKIVRLKPDDFLVHRQLAREYEALGNRAGAQQQRVFYLQKYDAALQAKAN